MKKVLIALSCVAFFGMASCKKEYTCECTVTDADGNVISEASEKTEKMKKSEAEDACNKGDSSAMGITSDCEITD